MPVMIQINTIGVDPHLVLVLLDVRRLDYLLRLLVVREAAQDADLDIVAADAGDGQTLIFGINTFGVLHAVDDDLLDYRFAS